MKTHNTMHIESVATTSPSRRVADMTARHVIPSPVNDVCVCVLLQDRVLSRVRVPSISLQLVAGCCVILAAKFEEPEQAVPRIDAVRACCGNVFSVSLFKVRLHGARHVWSHQSNLVT